MGFWKFDHVSLIVENLDVAMDHFDRLFGFDQRDIIVEHDYEDVDPNTGIADVLHFFLGPIGECYLELMEPVKEDGMMMKYLRRHGEGVHHVGVTSDDIVDEWHRLNGPENEFGTIERCPRVDQYNVSYWFLHPRNNHGMLIEVDAAWAKTSLSDMTPVHPTPDWNEILSE